MWGEKQREIVWLRSRMATLVEERDEARSERDDARANRKRTQDLYDNLVVERDAKSRAGWASTEKPAAAQPATAKAAGAEKRSEAATATDKLSATDPPAEVPELRRQLQLALSQAARLDRRVSELQAANLRYAREAYDQAAAVRKAEATGAGAAGA